MEHYFIDKPHEKDDFFEFTDYFNARVYKFNSCEDVFSKDKIDFGTQTLLLAIFKKVSLSGKVLDIGCGYGAITTILGLNFDKICLQACDVNNTAVELCKQNVIKNHLKNVENIFVSNCYEKVKDSYDYIVTNPPIKAGKTTLLNILVGAKEHLNENGKLIFVIKKKHGEESVKKELEKIYSIVEIIMRDKGYYVLMCEK